MSTVPDPVREAVGRSLPVDVDRTTVAVVAMLGVDALLWVLLVDGHVPMPGGMWLMSEGIPMAAPGAMLRGVTHVGTVGAVFGYATMWAVMMWAMMLPVMTRFVRAYVAAHEGSAVDVTRATTGFLVGYHAVWAASAVVPLATNALLPGGVYGVVRAHPHLAIGGALLVTGGYQLSRFKLSRLRACCGAVDPHRSGVRTALQDGLEHGGRCVLVCLAPFFVLMPVVGSMNVAWMLVLTGVVAMERVPSWGREVAAATGTVALLAGLVVLLGRPALPVAFVTGGM